METLEEYKAAFLQAQEEVDILFLGNNAGIDEWDEAEMISFVLDNSQIPSGTNQFLDGSLFTACGSQVW